MLSVMSLDSRSRGGWLFLAFAWIGVLALEACGGRVPEDEIVARVGDAVLKREVMIQRMRWEGMREDQENEFVERWVNQELLYQEARKLGLHKTEELRWELELVEKEFLIQKLLETTFANKILITEEEILSHYEKYKEEFRVDEDEVRALHILTKTREEANAARQEIRAGKPFEEVARELSVDIFRERGGDMGFFTRDDVIPEVQRYAFRSSEGTLSPVFSSSYGYHLLKVLKKRVKGDVKDLSDIRAEIIQRLRVNKERSVYYDLLFQLQNKTKIYVAVPRSREGKGDSLTVRTEETAKELRR